MSPTHDWLQLLLAEHRVPLCALILNESDLQARWNLSRKCLETVDLSISAIKSAIRDLMNATLVRVLVWPDPSSYHLAVPLKGRHAIEVIDRPNRELRRDRHTYLELTQEGTHEWENARKPDWDKFYINRVIACLEDGEIHVERVQCLTRSRLQELLDNYCTHFGYSDPPGLMHLTVLESTDWEATYWKKFDRYFEATFLAQFPPDEECCSSTPSEECRNQEIELRELFERWKLDG